MTDVVPAPQFLFAGDSTDLGLIERMLSRLPVGAHGRVLIEVAMPMQIRQIDAPEGIAVTWLCRDRDGIGRQMAARGERMVTALGAWFAEWLPAGDSHDPCYIWIGCAACPRVAMFHRALRQSYPHLVAEPAPVIPLSAPDRRADRGGA